VECVLEFLDKQSKNDDIPKHLQEDIQWAIDTISNNKLYIGNFDGFKLSEDRPEVKAWTDMIALKNIPQNKDEMERLRELEDLYGNPEEKAKLKRGASEMRQKKRIEEGPDDSKANLLLNQSKDQHMGSSP